MTITIIVNIYCSLRRATKTTEVPTMECLAYGKVNLAYLGAGEMEETNIYDLPRDWVYIKNFILYDTHSLNAVSVHCSSMYTHCILADMLFVMNSYTTVVYSSINCSFYEHFFIKALPVIERRRYQRATKICYLQCNRFPALFLGLPNLIGMAKLKCIFATLESLLLVVLQITQSQLYRLFLVWRLIRQHKNKKEDKREFRLKHKITLMMVWTARSLRRMCSSWVGKWGGLQPNRVLGSH